MDEIKKSINAVLYERLSSPLFGTIIISWVIWNWKIFYLTVFIDQDKIIGSKIDYIVSNYSNPHNLITFPLISSFLLLTIIPFISNGAFWLNLNFNKWKSDQKHKIEKKQLLTIEQSIKLRESLAEQEKRFEKLLEDKNNEIKQLNILNEQYRANSLSKEIKPKGINENIDVDKIYDRIKNNERELESFQKMLELIQSGYQITERSDVSPRFLTILEVNNIISPMGNGSYKLTESGKELARRLL